MQAIQDEWISNHGIYIDLASKCLLEILGVKHCILMNNGTSATHCLFKALKFMHPDIKKIYIPNNVFIAPWNCALQEYPEHMFEVMKLDEATMNIDVSEEYIMSLEKNSALVIVHNLGNIVNVPRLHSMRPDLRFVEDNCEGLFGKYNTMYSGTFPGTLCSSASFYGNKTITTGEGGAFFTNNTELYKYLKTFYSHGMSEQRYIHNMIGVNYRMTNVQGAFLFDQLSDIQYILHKKKKIFEQYTELFLPLVKNKKISYFKTDENTEQSKWMFIIQCKDITFTQLEKFLSEKNIQIRPLFYDIHEHLHLKGIKKHDIIVSEKIKYSAMLPSYPELTIEQQIYIVNCIHECFIFYSPAETN